MAYCAPCARHFVNEKALQQHFNTSSSHGPRKSGRSKPAEHSDLIHHSRPREPSTTKIVNPQTGTQVQTGKPSTYYKRQQRFRTESAPHQYRRDGGNTLPDQSKLDEPINSGHRLSYNKKFSNQQALDLEQRSTFHTLQLCSHCGMRFSSQKLLENHLENRHSVSRSKFEGRHPDLAALTIHGETAHPKQGFPCSRFDEHLPNLMALDQNEAHPKQGFPCYTCKPLCGRIFDTPEALNTHVQFMIEKLKLSIARNNKNTWTILQETPASISKLREMTHSGKLLEKNLYVMEFPSFESINNQRKCKHCREKFSKLRGGGNSICRYHPAKGKRKWNRTTKKTDMYFSCCGQQERCVTLDEHVFENFETLSQSLVFEKTPPPSSGEPKRRAVALDCEMGTSMTNSCELIQLSVVDYFTGEVLVDSIVRPKVKMSHYNSAYSGVTPQMMERAIDDGEFLDSYEGARAELWKWIDNETILIGHAMNHDLGQLHIIHPLIVDSYICIPKLQSSGNGLKTLAKQLLGKNVQEGWGGKRGHDCVEDALAARELVIWCSGNKAALEDRAVQAEEEQEIRRKEIEIQRAEKQALQAKKAEERLAGLAELDTSKQLVTTQERTSKHEAKIEVNADTKTSRTTGLGQNSQQNTWVWR